MPKWLVPVAVLIGLGVFLMGCVVSPYNGIVSAKNRAEREFGVVQAQLQRRADLIPNLVETARGYAEHERGTFREVTEARTRAQQILQVDPAQIAQNPQLQQQLQDAQNGLAGALSRLMVVFERYPDLKANDQFARLQAELSGTENRIATARRDAQVSIESYNNRIQQVPGVFYADWFNFDRMSYYQATTPNAEQAPRVDFSPRPQPAQ